MSEAENSFFLELFLVIKALRHIENSYVLRTVPNALGCYFI